GGAVPRRPGQPLQTGLRRDLPRAHARAGRAGRGLSRQGRRLRPPDLAAAGEARRRPFRLGADRPAALEAVLEHAVRPRSIRLDTTEAEPLEQPDRRSVLRPDPGAESAWPKLATRRREARLQERVPV